MKKPRHSNYPMSVEESEELARELDEFGYRETSDPDEADRRRYYKVEKWDADELHIVALARRPRGRYTLRQNIRVLDRWPPDRA